MKIICIDDRNDQYSNSFAGQEYLESVYFENDSNEGILNSNVSRVLAPHLPFLSSSVKDLLNLGLVVYSADQLISRKVHAFDDWSRHFEVHLPVRNLALWERCKNDIEIMLGFLTGDKWELWFRQGSIVQYEHGDRPEVLAVDLVSLFSGGMDSFLGANSLLLEGNRLALVSHHKSGPLEHPFQVAALNALRNEFDQSEIVHYDYYVQPNQKANRYGKENSSRGRSFLFLTLGIATAAIHGENAELWVPENGFISLNVPLTFSRIGALSTRTTHPYYLYLFEKVISQLSISNRITNPYRYKTKGEMLIESPNQDFLRTSIFRTMSCSDPSKARFTPGKTPPMHCGFCIPCVIRRAALKRARFPNSEEYVIEDFRTDVASGSEAEKNIRAFRKSIIEAHQNERTIELQILKSGPIPSDHASMNDYARMYFRGISEINLLFS